LSAGGWQAVDTSTLAGSSSAILDSVSRRTCPAWHNCRQAFDIQEPVGIRHGIGRDMISLRIADPDL